MEKSTIISLIKDVNSTLKNRTLSEMFVTKANSYHEEGLSESEVFNKVLADVDGLNKSLKNSALTEIVENYSKFKATEKFTIKNMANESGLFKLLTGIRASNAFADPVVMSAVTKIEENLSQFPEFKVIPSFIEALKPFSYDPAVKNAVKEASNYISKNGAKLLLLNAVYEFNMVPTSTYKNTVAIIEQALLDNQYSVDSMKMKLRESLEIPAIKRLISNLSLVESKSTKGFDLGTGYNKTSIGSAIVPTIKTNENKVITVLGGRFVEISENNVAIVEPKYVYENHQGFYNFVIAFTQMNFNSTNEGIATKLRKTEIEFKNEGADVAIYINKSKVNDLSKINYTELFVMETAAARQQASSLFENTDYIKSLDFIKKIAKGDKSCSAVNLGKKIFVMENNNSGQMLEMTATQFVKYVRENFDYDTAPMFADELESTEAELNGIETEKANINGEVSSLEKALNDLDAAEAGTTDEDILENAKDLRFNIEKKINFLKEKYITLDSKKRAILEHNIISSTKKHNLDAQIKTKDGRFGKVRGVDGSTGRYMVAFEDGRILPIAESEIL